MEENPEDVMTDQPNNPPRTPGPSEMRDFSRESGLPPFPVALDCRYYIGDRPCIFVRECTGCPHYSPQGTRILIIKTGALGDVLRTTILLGGIKRAYPESHITWITAPAAVPLVPGSLVDRIWPMFYPESGRRPREPHNPETTRGCAQ